MRQPHLDRWRHRAPSPKYFVAALKKHMAGKSQLSRWRFQYWSH
jgi:hypothetical protein